MKKLVPILLLILLLPGCIRKASAPDEHLAAAYVEVSNLAARYQHSDSTYSAARYQQELRAALEPHGFTPESFRAAIDTLAQQPVAFRAFTERVNALAVKQP